MSGRQIIPDLPGNPLVASCPVRRNNGTVNITGWRGVGVINPQVANVFHEIADLLELSGENPFRIRAYRRAAMNVEAIPKDIAAMSEEELQSLPGIGKDLAHKIRQFVDTGRIDAHEELQKKIPRGLLEILRVPGIGPKTARLLFDKKKVKSLEELETLARSGNL